MDKGFVFITDIFDTIGFHGPLIILIISTLNLWLQTKYMLLYLGFAFINIYFNRSLKMLFKEPRPIDYDKETNITKNLEYYSNGDQYGMPSGHSNLSFFTIGYNYLVKPKINYYFLLELVTTAITVTQRYKYKKHTLKQLFVGGVVGLIYAYVAYEISKIAIKNYHE